MTYWGRGVTVLKMNELFGRRKKITGFKISAGRACGRQFHLIKIKQIFVRIELSDEIAFALGFCGCHERLS